MVRSVARDLPEQGKNNPAVNQAAGNGGQKMGQYSWFTVYVDMAAFAGYCQAYAWWKEAEEFITQHGSIVKTPSGYWQQVPQVSIAQTYLKIMNRFAEQFGLTPSSRSRIIAEDNSNSTVDEMEALLGGGS